VGASLEGGAFIPIGVGAAEARRIDRAGGLQARRAEGAAGDHAAAGAAYLRAAKEFPKDGRAGKRA